MFDKNAPMGKTSSQRTILFCPYCGTKLDPGANFCKSCGASVAQTGSGRETPHGRPTQRETVYEGYIHKCPNCGEVLESFTTNCPACGHEVRNAKTADSVRKFAAELAKIETKRLFTKQKQQEKANMIINYSLPNTKEDIREFMLLASSNIDTNRELNDIVTSAWISKLDQVYQKAVISMSGDEDFKQIEEIYLKKQREIKAKKLRWFLGISIALGIYFILFGMLWISEGEVKPIAIAMVTIGAFALIAGCVFAFLIWNIKKY